MVDPVSWVGLSGISCGWQVTATPLTFGHSGSEADL